jgi:hypothetical protein
VSERIPCELTLIRYAPDPVKAEFVNIGVLLREAGHPESSLVRFTKDWSRVRCIDPDADVETLEGLETEIRRALEQDDQATLKRIHESFSQQVQLSTSKACLAESLPAEMEQAMRLYVEPRKRERMARQSGRMAIHARMRTEFERAGVWDLMRKRISVASYTAPGDPLRIDCGYRNGRVRMFHAVSLESDTELAKVLAYSFPALSAGVLKAEGAELELTAVVQPWARVEEEEQLAQYRFAVETMESQKIRVLTTNQLPDVADTARRELRV